MLLKTRRTRFPRLGRRIAATAGTVLFALACLASPETACGQGQPRTQNGNRFPPLNLFRRPQADQAQRHPQMQSPSEPKPLQVVDRATARRLAADQNAAATAQHATQLPPPTAQYAEQLTLQDDTNPLVRPASFQTPAARVYRTPPVNPYAYDPYAPSPAYDDYAPGYDPAGTDWGTPYGAPLPGMNSMQPVPSVQFGDTSPDPVPYYQGESIDVGQSPPPATGQLGPMSSTPQGYPSGQGYLQQGSPFHGQYLSQGFPTATERALELQTENLKLRESLTRVQLELSNRIEEIAQLNLASRQKDDDLKRAQTRIDELTRQVTRLSGELNQAIRERNEIERKANEQLMNIESVLDSVLMEALTDRKGG